MTINYFCDCCGQKLNAKGYYETQVTVTVKVATNSDSEPERNDRNKTNEMHFCPNCYDTLVKPLNTMLCRMAENKEDLEKYFKKSKK